MACFVSLGDRCAIAGFLKNVGWKRSSFPFDWILSSPSIVRHMLQDNFSTLLTNPKFYETLAGQPIYMHHSPYTDKGYYVRCVGRFRQMLASSVQPIGLMNLTMTGEGGIPSTKRTWTHQDFKQIRDLMVSPFGASNPKLLVVYLVPEGDGRHAKVDHLDPNISCCWIGLPLVKKVTWGKEGQDLLVKIISSLPWWSKWPPRI
jgi:hypothetical protein